LGSPIWPLFAAIPVAEIDAYFSRNMVGGREALDHLLLPLRLFQGDAEIPLARPPFLFMLVPLYALVRKHRVVSGLLALAAIHLAVWSQLTPTVRYLAPIFPALSLGVAYLLLEALSTSRLRRPARLMAPVLVLVSMLVGVGIVVLLLAVERPFAQLAGLESRNAYLSRVLRGYDAVRYVNEHRTEVSRLLVVGDARLFYLTCPVLLGHGLGHAVELGLAGESRDAVEKLQRAGISHVLIGYGHLGFLAQFDPEGRVSRWIQDFERTRPAYLTTEYGQDNVVRLYRVADTDIERIAP
jgi:hypothetical protein